jgi:23S rRNA pseudouridine1911/1915/1917 synthase
LAPLRFHVSDDDGGARLDRVLASRPEIAARSFAERLISTGAVRVDGELRPKSHRLTVGQTVEVELPPASALEPEQLDIPIIWEDGHLLVVDKPAGMVVHPVGSNTSGTLAHGVLALGAEGGDDERPGIVHRLDRDTSGLLVVARSEEAHTALQDMIQKRAVERRYLALVRGQPRSRTGKIDAAIGRDRFDRARHSLDTATPRTAVTWFELLEHLGERALLEVSLETGRTHQIRVHLEAIDLPVSGDPIYGAGGDLGLERQFLHAHRLCFPHPLTGQEIDVSSPLPADLAVALERARSEA